MALTSCGSVCACLSLSLQVGNSRKAMTITLSFLLFPKPFSVHYLMGGGLVLGGLTASAWLKNYKDNSKHNKAATSTGKAPHHLHGDDSPTAITSSSSSSAPHADNKHSSSSIMMG